MGDVGTSKIFENDKVIIWEFALQPGESTATHTHKHDYMFYVLDGTTLDVFDADDKELYDLELKTGETFAFNCEGDELVSADGKGHRLPATHSARNTSSAAYREVLIETK